MFQFVVIRQQSFNFISRVINILNIIKNYKIENNQLVIELTESGFIESNKNFIDFCNGLKKANILLALDDFGTGYSNFHYLYNLKPDYIKIDRTLMKNALSNEYENMLLKHMVDMAHSVGVKICIEGIEEKEELERIMLLKPDYIEGFSLLGGEPFEPENQEELVRLLKRSKKIIQRRISGAIQDILMTRICSKVVKYTHRLRKRCYLILIRWLMDSLSNPRKLSH